MRHVMKAKVEPIPKQSKNLRERECVGNKDPIWMRKYEIIKILD